MSAATDAAAIIAVLRAAREARGWSPERVASEARNRTDYTLTGMTIRRSERGRYFPTLPSLIAWGRALDLPITIGTSS